MNKGEMVTQCLDRMGAGRQSNTRLTAKIDAQLNAAYGTLCGRQHWPWLRMRTTVAVTPTTVWVPFPTTTKAGVTVQAITRVQFCVLASSGAPMHPRPEMIDAIATGEWARLGSRSTPSAWCTCKGEDGLKDELLFMPLPASTDTVYLWGLRSFASLKLVEDTDVPVFDEEYHQYIVEKAMGSLGAMDGTFDPAVAQMAVGEAGLIYRDLMHTSVTRMPAPVQQLRWGGFGQVGGLR